MAAERFFLLHFLRRLPEEQIRRDGRAEDGDERCPPPGPTGRRGQKRIMGDGAPMRADLHGRDDVGEEHEREPLEGAGNGGVAEPDRRPANQHGEPHHPEVRAGPRQKLCRVGHSGEIGSDVDGVGDEEREADRCQDGTREFFLQRAHESFSGHHADPGTHELHCRHQRPRDECRPEECRSKARAGDGVRGDAGRIVIGRAGDDTGTECGPESTDGAHGALWSAHCGARSQSRGLPCPSGGFA